MDRARGNFFHNQHHHLIIGTNAKLNIYSYYYLDSSNHLQRILFMGTFKGNCAINGVNLKEQVTGHLMGKTHPTSSSHL